MTKRQICGIVALIIILSSQLHAQSIPKQAGIIGSIATGEDRAPAPKKPQPVFVIKNTQHRHVKGRSITIHEILPPPVQEGRPSLHDLEPDIQPEAQQNTKETEVITTRVLFVSGVVYGKLGDKLAKLRVWCDGDECEILTNIDFKYFSGFGGFRVKNRAYMCLPNVVVNTEDSSGSSVEPVPEEVQIARRLAKSGTANRYAVIKTNTEAAISPQVLDDIVTLYEQEKDHLKAAYEARAANDKIRAARLAAEGPPPPKPITIHFWKRDVEEEQEQEAAQKGETK